LEAKDGGKRGRGRENQRKYGWRILYMAQIFLGAEKQSGIDAIRRGARMRGEERRS